MHDSRAPPHEKAVAISKALELERIRCRTCGARSIVCTGPTSYPPPDVDIFELSLSWPELAPVCSSS